MDPSEETKEQDRQTRDEGTEVQGDRVTAPPTVSPQDAEVISFLRAFKTSAVNLDRFVELGARGVKFDRSDTLKALASARATMEVLASCCYRLLVASQAIGDSVGRTQMVALSTTEVLTQKGILTEEDLKTAWLERVVPRSLEHMKRAQQGEQEEVKETGTELAEDPADDPIP